MRKSLNELMRAASEFEKLWKLFIANFGIANIENIYEKCIETCIQLLYISIERDFKLNEFILTRLNKAISI